MSILQNKQELFNPVKEYWEDLKCKDLKLYDETNKILEDNKLINKYNKHIDNACFHTINYYENVNLLMCVNLSKKESYNYYLNNLKNSHKLYGIKNINIRFNVLHKILYQIKYFDIYNYYDLMKKINNDYLFYSEYDKEYIEINILMLINKKYDTFILEEKENSILLYSNNKYQKKVISSIFYNENSINFIEKQNIEKLLSSKYEDNLKEIFGLKDEISKYDHFTQENILICSSSILMILGLRKNNDIDVYVDNVKNKEELMKTLNNINNLDFKMKGTDNWPKYWDTWLDEWAQKCGAKYFEEIVGFQDYHFYFCGVKFMDLKVDVQRRIYRQRPAASTDIIMLNKIFNLNISIPEIPEVFYEYKSLLKLSESDKDKLIEEGAIYNPENREYKIEKKTNINNYLFKVQEYLKIRYNQDYSIEDIKNIFNIFNKKTRVKIKIKK